MSAGRQALWGTPLGAVGTPRQAAGPQHRPEVSSSRARARGRKGSPARGESTLGRGGRTLLHCTECSRTPELREGREWDEEERGGKAQLGLLLGPHLEPQLAVLGEEGREPPAARLPLPEAQKLPSSRASSRRRPSTRAVLPAWYPSSRTQKCSPRPGRAAEGEGPLKTGDRGESGRFVRGVSCGPITKKARGLPEGSLGLTEPHRDKFCWVEAVL